MSFPPTPGPASSKSSAPSFLRLFHYWRSSASWRVRWALELKGLRLGKDVEMVPVDLLDGTSESPEHHQRSPLGFVPVLESPEGFLTESLAVIQWLEDSYPTPSLFPCASASSSANAWRKAQALALAEIINASTQPFQNPSTLEALGTDPKRHREWIHHFVSRGLSAFQTLALRTPGRYSMGDEISLPDLFLVPQIYASKRFEVDLAPFPRLAEIYERCLELESCQNSHPDRFHKPNPSA